MSSLINQPSFTILIPYHGNEHTLDFLKRQLRYYHADTTPMNVLMAISGDQLVQDELQAFIKNMKDERFHTILTPETDVTNVSAFLQKIYEALLKVQTPYVMLNGADDVVFPETVAQGTKILSKDHTIAAIKGKTVRFNQDNGQLIVINDPPILGDSAHDRLKDVLRDRDSVFYIIQRTKEIIEEYKNLIQLSQKTHLITSSLYHMEHFKAMSLAALGKIYVFEEPWRLYNVHRHNHTAHTPASFSRVEHSCINKYHYTWFQALNKGMEALPYWQYWLLWELYQIAGIHIHFKQILYFFYTKKISMGKSLRISTYWILNKVFLSCSRRSVYLKIEIEYFIKTDHFRNLKSNYFSQNDIKMLDKNYQ